MRQMTLTKAQRRAVYRVWHRWHSDDETQPISYRVFREEVQPTFGMDDAVVVQVPGMWLAIEADGYTHS